MWQLATSLWHQLSAAEQAVWESAGTARGMTGYAWYMSQALRPNPGIYLPLAGGVMAGDVDMDQHQVMDLPAPVADQDAARKGYVDAEVAGAGGGQGARVIRTSNQLIPHNTLTAVSFDTEDYDNDNMWEGVTNPTYLTIRTPGIYLFIGQVHWAANAAGFRTLLVQLLPAGYIAQVRTDIDDATNEWRGQISTTWQCSAGNTALLYVYQNSGGNLNISHEAGQAPVLQAVRIG